MSKSLRMQTVLVLASAATLTLSSATVVSAAEDPPPPDSGEEVAWPPADTDGEWLAVPEEQSPDFTVDGCGSTLQVSAGDVNEAEYQAMEQADGTIRVEYRGETTTDITRESDGAMIDELDTGGPGHEVYSPDGLTVVFSSDGPSIILAFDEVEAAVFAEQAGLPPIFYYEEGNFTERVLFSADPEAATIESAEVLTDTIRGAADVCDLLDDVAH